MKAQRNVRSVPNASKGQHVKVLLVGREDQFKGNRAGWIFNGNRIWRSASLLGALKRLQSDAIDVVLLGDKFRPEEQGLFVTGARRGGFAGLILCLAPTGRFGSDFFRVSSSAGLSPTGSLEDLLHAGRKTIVMRGGNERSNAVISLNARERAVLARVSDGWTNQQVARELKCTEGGVKAILQQLFRKLGVRKRAQIVRLAFEKGLFDAEEGARGRPHRATKVANLLMSAAEYQEKQPISVGHFVVDVVMHRVWVRGVETHLTPTEFELLAIFVMHPGELLESNRLREIFWRNPTSKQDSLRILVAALRAKIEVSKTPQYIVTERSFGYRFNPSPSSPRGVQSNTPPPGVRVG